MKVWRGRMRRQLERAFIAMPGQDLDTGTFMPLGLGTSQSISDWPV
jgi:hypothetical protein